MLTCSWFAEELKDYLFGAHAINKIVTLGSLEFPVSWENEIKLWTFLETRAALLLKAYKITSEVSVQSSVLVFMSTMLSFDPLLCSFAGGPLHT